MIQIPPDRLILLDSCTLIHLQRGKATGLAIEAAYGLKGRVERPLLSSIVEGEVMSLASGPWKWGPVKMAALAQRFAHLVRVSAGEPAVVAAYATLAAHQSAIGKKLGENDTWIAATAVAVGAVLLTCDGDFLNAVASVDVAHFDVTTNTPGH